MNIIIKIKRGLLITAIPLLLSGNCNKDGSTPCAHATYSFTVTSEFNPQKEIYNIGDTLFLNSSFSKNLNDLASNYLVEYSNSLGVGGNIIFGIMDTINKIGNDAYSKFQVYPIAGTFTPISGALEKGLNSRYSEGANYTFKIGIIMKQKGIYVLGVTNLLSQSIIGKNCTNASFDMNVTNTEKHFNLFQYALGFPADALHIKNGYCFRVQ